jgi:translation elongation factor EF-Ts
MGGPRRRQSRGETASTGGAAKIHIQGVVVVAGDREQGVVVEINSEGSW